MRKSLEGLFHLLQNTLKHFEHRLESLADCFIREKLLVNLQKTKILPAAFQQSRKSTEKPVALQGAFLQFGVARKHGLRRGLSFPASARLSKSATNGGKWPTKVQ